MADGKPWSEIGPPAVDLDADQAARFIEVRYQCAEPDELLNLWRPGVKPTRPMGRDALLTALRESESGLADLYWGDPEHDEPSGPHNIYIAMNSLARVPDVGHRGKTPDMRRSFGCWLDLDVKGGQDWNAVIGVVHRMDSLGLRPQLLVASGSGGAHLHWRYDSPQEPAVATTDSERMQLLVEQEFPGWEVDDIADATRVLRLPGTQNVKWTEEGGWDCRPVALLREDAHGAVPRERIIELTGETFTKVRRERYASSAARKARERTAMAKFTAAFISQFGDAGEVITAWRITELCRLFELRMTWERILRAAGWTYAGHDGGADVWTRPGGASAGRHSVAERSATVNFPHPNSAMSLLSGSPHTGLLELKKSGVVLTKLRVAAELHAGGDIEVILLGWAREAREKGLWS